MKRSRIAAGLALVLALAAAYWLLRDSALMAAMLDGEALRVQVARLGAWGPVAVIALMTLAILVSPIPSAPIALAAGALYGHFWGTLYVLLGAEIGALAAFGIARLVGYEVLRRWLGERLSLGWLGSQNALMGLVFVSRLLPFVSFDVISYAAGLTVLSAWRFALATLAGIVPASFLLAHFGAEMMAGEADQALIAALALGILVAVPLVVKFVREYFNARKKT
ncbi:MAG TPA: VTT domain-containing protein [Burkholderiales bacterium]